MTSPESSPPPERAPAETSRRPAYRRAAVAGFALGFLAAFVVTAAALASGVAERLHPVLVPAKVLLGPLSDTVADWNGLASMSLAGVVNGAVYALLAVALAALTPIRLRSASA